MMKLDVMTGGLGLRAVQGLARQVAERELSGLVITEAGRGAYLSCAAAALAADIDVSTGIAVAFPRSPMVTATTAWELADATGGRFRLGLGTQVRAHIERRYSTDYDHPGPRIREYIQAIRAIFRAFRGEEKLSFQGDYYDFSLLPRAWSPGALEVDDPPIDVAAVNPWMLRMAGEFADGVHVHPLNTQTYLAETVLPSLAEGADRAGRARADLEVVVPSFIVVGDTDEEQAHLRELARFQVAFYGSTPNYSFIFDQVGHDGTTGAIRERQKAGDMAGMAAVVTDDILEHFIVSGSWSEIAGRLSDRYEGRATRVIDYFSGLTYEPASGLDDRWTAVARALRS